MFKKHPTEKSHSNYRALYLLHLTNLLLTQHTENRKVVFILQEGSSPSLIRHMSDFSAQEAAELTKATETHLVASCL